MIDFNEKKNIKLGKRNCMSVMKYDKFDRFYVINISLIVYLIFLVFYNLKYMIYG